MVKAAILLLTGRTKTEGNSRDSLVSNFYEMERETLFLIWFCLAVLLIHNILTLSSGKNLKVCKPFSIERLLINNVYTKKGIAIKNMLVAILQNGRGKNIDK